MERERILHEIAEINPRLIPQVRTLLDCKARFCRITMKPDPVDDLRRGGKQRVFIVNVRATYQHMMKRHFDPQYRFNPQERTSAMKGRITCTRKGILGVVESVRVGSVNTLQYRNVDLKKVQSIECGGIHEDFS